jgi:nucleotide-binding universal stress UspA family protein
LGSKGIAVKSEARTGEIAREVITLADEEQVRMIAMLKYRRSSISPLSLGSIADKVMRRETIPVLLFSTPSGSQKR